MSDLSKTLVVVNPAAGGGRAGQIWDRLVAARPVLAGIRTILTRDAVAAADQVDAGLDGEPQRVIVLGGDGTVSLVANRLLARGAGRNISLGMLRAGTGSDLARSLGLPRRPEAALDRVLGAAPRPIDAIEVETDDGCRRYVINIASAGVSGSAAEWVNAVPDRGRFTYLRGTIVTLLRHRPVRCRVLADDEEIYDDGFFLVAVANGQYFGKGMRVAPEAILDDGELDVILVPPVPLWKLPYRMPQFLAGKHLNIPGVQSRRARTVRFEPRDAMPPYELDGETLRAGSATFRIQPQGLQILA